MAANPIIKQLNRFEVAGVLVSSRIYSFNPKSSDSRPVKEIVEKDYESIPLIERQKSFETRRRPRRKRKPVI